MENPECYIDFKDIGNKNIKDIVEKHGYAVITNVIEQNKADNYIGEMWSWLENLSDASGTKSGIDRNDSNSWVTYEKAMVNGSSTYNWPKNSYGIISNYGISHTNFVWKARCEPNIRNIFENIWDTSELISSFDGACIMLPPSISKTTNTQSWFHFDQSPKSSEFSCVQGFLNLENSTEQDGCLMVYPRSNHYHKKFFEEKNLSFESDWYSFNDVNKGNEWMVSQGLSPIKVTAPKGSFVLWDSRTVHCSCLPTSNNIRYCIYVCMLPTYYASRKQLQEKNDIFAKRLGTSHWPHKNEIVYDESVLFEPNEGDPKCLNYVSKDNLEVTDEVLQLVGHNMKKINKIKGDLEYLKMMFNDLSSKFSDGTYNRKIYQEIVDDFDGYYQETMSQLFMNNVNLDKIKSRTFYYHNKTNFLIEM